MSIRGTIWKFGNDVDTDVILPARYLNTSDPHELARHCMEDADPDFSRNVKPGDVILAGKNFGCGSSREHAPIAIQGARIGLVIAESFARIFYRNAFNIGLPILESAQAAAEIRAGDDVEVDIETGVIIDHTTEKRYQAKPIPLFMRELLSAGGLVPYVRRQRQRPNGR
jgi:3-isopropylmalate/(R)-2-methylmalate dehydratase small subunit